MSEQTLYTFDDWSKPQMVDGKLQHILDGVRHDGELAGDNPNILFSKGLISTETAEQIRDAQVQAYNDAIEVNYKSITMDFDWQLTTCNPRRQSMLVTTTIQRVEDMLLKASHAEKFAAQTGVIDTYGIDGLMYARIQKAKKHCDKGGSGFVHITKRIPGMATIFNHRQVTAVNQMYLTHLQGLQAAMIQHKYDA